MKSGFESKEFNPVGLALRVSVLYGLVGCAWILLSDEVLEFLIPSKEMLSQAQTYKGLFFILFTGVCLYFGLKHKLALRLNTQKALIESETKYRRIVETSEEGIWLIDAEAKTTFVNQKMAEILGYAPTEMAGRPLHDFMDAEDIKICSQNLDRRRQGIRETHEFRFKRKDGSFIWTMLNASPMLENNTYLGSLAMVTDISERKRSQEELQRSRDLLTAAEQQAQLGSWRMDHGSKTLLCSPEMRRLLGSPDNSEITLQTFLSRIHEEDRPRIESCFSGECCNCSTELRFVDAKGGTRHIAFAYSATRNKAGAIEYLQGIAQDITERKHTENQLRQTQKMTAVGQLAGGVAHDFNNQLAAILGYAAMLKEQASDKKMERYAEKICIAAERSADLTQKLLAFSHKGTSQRIAVDIQKILSETTEILQRSIDKRIRIEQDFGVMRGVVSGDPSQLQSAFLNLALNARDAMPEGGTLRFETDLCELQPDQYLEGETALSGGDYLRVRVCDTGMGMTPEVRRRLFEPFFTTKPMGKGTGLGLASVYGTVRNHSGVISVDSTLRQGTTFTVMLPLYGGPIPQSHGNGSNSNAREPFQCILLAEDEPDLRELMQEALSPNCSELLVAKDGLQAIEHFKQHHEKIDLVVMDMQMPGASGSEVITRIREIDPQVRILVTSGYAEVELPNVSAFLQKPFRVGDLQTTIQSLSRKPAGV